ncbi:hypothetical protein [Pilimelia columellifera]|uniref:hypothetical protein n=1 Tax=Pilimelia columellifera TaxID=706574 RepID=UPI0031D7BF25
MTSTASPRDARQTPDIDSPAPTGPPDQTPRPPTIAAPRWWQRPVVRDVGVALLFLAGAAAVLSGLLRDPNGRWLALNPEDQTLYEWFLAVDTGFWSGEVDLVTDRLNAPDGVNLLTNTTVIALGLLFTPVTWAFGAPVSFALIATLNLAGTAFAWHLLLARGLLLTRGAAMAGGALCGFGPGIISQNNSHLHMTAQWLTPVIVWCVLALARSSRPDQPRTNAWWTASFGLAAVVTVQIFIGEEVLFLTAVTLLLVTLGYTAARPRLARRLAPRFVGGIVLAAVAALVPLAYPLWTQFFGPQGVRDGIFSASYFSADLASWPAFSALSLAGSPGAADLTTGPAEYNAFVGWPLLALAVACAIWQRRDAAVATCGAAALGMALLSLGPTVVVNGHRTAIPGPYALIDGAPLVDGALPMRFALAALPLLAVIIAVAIDRAAAARRPLVRYGVPVAALAALLPAAPLPLPTEARPPLPEFIAGGHWRQCVPEGGVLVPVPLATPPEPGPMRWATAAHATFGMPQGFFIGPYGENGTGTMGIHPRPTSQLLTKALDGEPVTVTPADRAAAQEDVRYWAADCVALADGTAGGPEARVVLEQLFGPGTRIADAWTWRL